MKKDRYAYVAIFSYEEDGISIEFPDLPGCYPCAGKDDTVAAIANAKEAMGLHMWGMEQDEEGVNCSKIFQNALMEYLHLEPPKGLIKNQ